MSLKIIAGEFKGRPLKAPKGSSTRPTQGMLRGAVFNICQNRIEGAKFLDIYAGSGAMAFEALSRGASYAVLIEKNKLAIQAIEENRSSLKVEAQTQVIKADVMTGLRRIEKKFDIVYIDPPYDTPMKPLVEELIKSDILEQEAIVFIEERDTKSTPPQFESLVLKDSRRFGVALLHQYRFLSL